jgi:ABC-2 type transport system ATP-binding protein
MGEVTTASTAPALRLEGVRKSFLRETGERVAALDNVSFDVGHGELAALVGPDGAGKTTLIRLVAGLMSVDSGSINVLGIDAAKDPQSIQSRISYMPQRFGLYDDLTVEENLRLYADLHGLTEEGRRRQYPGLMEMTALGPFQKRLAGKLSGGMKQKLGLACTLVSSPELLLLDEPTVGVDPLSRRELWGIIRRLVKEGLTVLLSSSYLDEAEECRRVLVLHEGRSLAVGDPSEVRKLADGRTYRVSAPAPMKAREFQSRLLDEPGVVDAVPEGGQVRVVRREPGRTGGGDSPLIAGARAQPTPARFEDGFMMLLHRNVPAASEVRGALLSPHAPSPDDGGQTVVEVHNLVREFGKFVAVDHVNFSVRRGEIYGLLGPNGAGKTTTFRMLCGLLPASSGTLTVAGIDVRKSRASARQHLGYVAQKFSLYGQLTVGENLDFFARAYGLNGQAKRERIAWAMSQFQLESLVGLQSVQLPGGYKQRLAMAAALLHEPEILFLDEPTSGADPLARRDFWRRITSLASTGVTVIVTTHFMAEAEYCDRAAILDGGKLLAEGTPAELRGHARPENGREATMEDAFIAVVLEARAGAGESETKGGPP